MSLIGEAFVRIRPDDTGFRAEATKQVKRDLSGVDRSLSSSNRELGRFSRGALVGTGALGRLGRAAAFASASFIGGAGIIVGLKAASEAASNLNEQTSKSAVVFGKSQDAIVEWSKTSATALGLAHDQAIQAAAGFGALLRPLGQTEQAAAANSKRLTQLAADLASFSNTSVTDALQALSSGLVGEIEPLRRYGVVLSEAAVQQKALTQTGKESVKQLTAQEKVAARLAIIFDQTKQAQGDFARTSGGLANQQRILAANLRDLAASIGQVVNPALLEAVTRINKFLADPANQERIQGDIQRTAETTKNAVGILARTYNGAKNVAHDFASALNSIDHALGGGKPNQDAAQAALEKEIQAYKTLIELQRSSLALQNERNPAQGLQSFPVSPIDIPSRVKGQGFVGRPLTATEKLAIALATNPNDVQALQAQRAQYQKALNYAQSQVDAEVGNTAQWAKDIAFKAGQIQQINDDLNRIASDKAAKAEAARLAAIEKLIPNSIGGRGFAGGAFARFQALIAGRIPGQVSGGGGPVDVSALVDQSKAQQEAQLRTQIAEATVTNEKRLIPFYQAELAADQEHLKLLRKIGATTVQKLQEQLNIAQTKKRIRDILHSDKSAEDAFSIQDLFGEGGRQFAAYGSNVAPLTQPLSRQEAGGAAVRAAQAGGKTINITQIFPGDRNASQAINEASNAARALRY